MKVRAVGARVWGGGWRRRLRAAASAAVGCLGVLALPPMLAVGCAAAPDCAELRACPPADGGAGGAAGDGSVARPDGEACGQPGECSSGHCVDGVCCAGACAGSCERCDGAVRGVCAPVAEGSDPDAECGGSGTSTADAACAGACDGVGACRFPGAATPCGAAACTGSVLIGLLCDGAGACREGSTDCDDGLFCNGAEACQPTGCQAGAAPVCPVVDAVECVPACAEGTGGHVCGAVARDADGDRHGTPRCAESPGDDCDDGDPSVHPAAAERCNGIDDDCDGAVDLDDGLTPGGALHTVAQSTGTVELPAVTWDDAAGVFGVVWADGGPGNLEIQLARVDPAGALVGAALRVTDTPEDESFPTVAAAGGGYAVAWAPAAGGGPRFRRVSGAGALVGSPVELDPTPPPGFGATGLQIARPPGGPWLVAWTHVDLSGDDSLRGAAVADDGTLVLPARALLAGGGEPALGTVVAVGSAVWAAHVDGAGRTRLAQLTSALDPLGAGLAISDLGATTRSPLLVARADDLWVAFQADALAGDAELRVARVGADASVVECAPTVVATAASQAAGGLVATSTGVLGVSLTGPGDGTTAVLAQRYDATCVLAGDPLNLSGGSPWRDQGAAFPRVASGGGHIAVVWPDQVTRRVLLHVLGQHLCD